MEALQEVLKFILHPDLKVLIEQIGYVGVYLIVFAESGLLIGFFLPGDSLLFTAGFLASPVLGFFNIWFVILGCWAAAVIGDNVGYEFGKRVGAKLFTKDDSWLFHKKNLIKAQEFYEKHGGKAIVIARFIPVVRTFAPVIAGVGHMDHKKFTFFNFLGGTLWVWGLGFLGYFLGSTIPNVDKYLLPIILAIMFFSIAPAIWHLYKENREGFWTKLYVGSITRLKALKYRIFR